MAEPGAGAEAGAMAEPGAEAEAGAAPTGSDRTGSSPPRREIALHTGDLKSAGCSMIAVAVASGQSPPGAGVTVDRWTGGALSRALQEGSFRADKDEHRLFSAGPGDHPHVLAIGIGEEPADAARVRALAGRAVAEARVRRFPSVGLAVPLPASGGAEGAGRASGEAEDADSIARLVQAAAEGFLLGDWGYDALRGHEERAKRGAGPSRAVICLEAGTPPAPDALARVATAPDALARAAERGRMLAESQNFARELVTLPGNVLTPAALADAAIGLGAEFDLRVEVWGPERLRKEGFGALLAVARGSREEPRFIIVEHAGAGGRPHVLVGKGVTFDAGGISIKPAAGMEAMKYDMAGAAAVLGAIRAVAALGLERRVIALVPSTENLPSGTALKPADVIRGLANRSIEVINTDAEGRLILSDALAFAARLDPVAVVDLATLTGGCVVALGRHAMGLMSTDDGLAAALDRAGERSGERVWRLPLWPEYRKQLDSEIAEIKNTGGREASTITAGWFLREFIGDAPWAHLDIAGTAWAEEGTAVQPKGATGVGVRLLAEWLGAD